MPDERPISSSRITAADVARHSFDTVRRGFDPREVRSYLELVSRELQSRDEYEQQFRRQLQEAEERARNPVLDEATLTTALGQQTAQVLRKAHEEAARLVTEAEQRAAGLAHEAQQRASEMAVQAEAQAAERIAQAELQAAAVDDQARADAERLLEEARQEGENIIQRAREHGRVMVEEAQGTRKRVLTDLAQRRRAVHIQIEQLRAARDEIAAAVSGVRESVDGITSALARSDDDARQAAMEAAQRTSPEAADELGDLDVPAPLVGDVLVEEPSSVVEVATPAGSGEVPGDGGPGSSGTATPGDRGGVGPTAPEGGGLATREGEAVVTEVAEDEASSPSDEPGGEGETGGTTGELGASDSVDDRSLEDLFARIRASQGSEEAKSAPAARSQGAAGSVATRSEGAAGHGDSSGPGVSTVVGAPPGDATALAQRRDALISPIGSRLTRQVKRALQDDQNRILEALRQRSGTWSADLLSAEEEHRDHFVAPATALLGEARTAGRQFAVELGAEGDAAGKAGPAVDEIARDLGSTVVTLLRRRLPGGEEAPSPDDVDDAADVVGAAFREWRGARVERLVGDHIVQAFGLGVVSASDGGEVRWLVGGDGAPCADCEDNSLADGIVPGQDFPTGQPFPPAHPGCRCVVVPRG